MKAEIKKNVLILGIYPPPFGGVSTIIKNLVAALINNKSSVYVFSPGYEGGDLIDKDLIVHKPIKRQLFSLKFLFSCFYIKIYLLLIKNNIYNIELKRIIRISAWIYYLKKEVISAKKVDLICAFHLFDRGLTAAILGLLYDIPIITVNLGEIYVDTPFYKKNIEAVKFIINNSKKIISVSKHCAKSYNLLELDPKVEIIYSGVDTSIFHPNVNSDIIKNKFGLSANDFVVLFVGRMIYDMGLDHLMQAIPVILDYKSTIKFVIGGAKGELTDEAFDLKQKYPNNIYISVNIPSNDLPYYYASSDLIVVPTSDDRACMGLAIKEAMFSCKPVIGNRAGGIPEAIINTKSGLIINTQNIKELSSAVLELERDRILLNKMGKTGYNHALKLFSSDSANNKYIKLFDSVID